MPYCAALARPDRVEQPRDDAVEAALLVVGEREELVHRLRVGVRPAALRSSGRRRGARPRRAASPRGGRRRPRTSRRRARACRSGAQCSSTTSVPSQVRDERVHRLLDDQPHADGGGEVVDDVALVDELVHDRRVEHGVDDEVEVPDGRAGARRSRATPVERSSSAQTSQSLVEEELGEVGADEARAAGDQRLAARAAEPTAPFRRGCGDAEGCSTVPASARSLTRQSGIRCLRGTEGLRTCSSDLQSVPGRSSSSRRTKHVR